MRGHYASFYIKSYNSLRDGRIVSWIRLNDVEWQGGSNHVQQSIFEVSRGVFSFEHFEKAS